MTCIVALKHKNHVYMGSDSACSHGNMVKNLAESKTFSRDGLIVGAAGYVRPAQVLQYGYKWPLLAPKADVDNWLFNEFIPGWQEALKQHKNLQITDEQVLQDSTLLIGVRGRIFEVCGMFEVLEVADEYHSIGCGEEIACGVMYATKKAKLRPEARLLMALNAASYHCGGVRPPFHIGRA